MESIGPRVAELERHKINMNTKEKYIIKSILNEIISITLCHLFALLILVGQDYELIVRCFFYKDCNNNYFSFRLEVDEKNIPYKLPELIMRAKDGIRLHLTQI